MAQTSAAGDLKKEVLDSGLCTFCGACVGHCPYLREYRGRVVVLDSCNLCEGECYKYCPRTTTDWDVLNQTAFGVPYTLDGLGTVEDIFMCRSTSSHIHQKGQDGGVVTTLLTAAMEEGLINAAVLTKMSDDKSPSGFVARSKEEILQCAGNSYEASFSLEAFNRLPKESDEKLGVVGLPCQVEALTKMRAYPPQNRAIVDNIKFVLGLFCGWALLPHQFHRFLREIVDLSRVIKFDIPHHPADSFDIYEMSGVKSIKLDEIKEFINPACSYCTDMTSEFADISVGSGRRIFGWNTVIVRSERGRNLIELAATKGVIQIQELPQESLEHLKEASLLKKKRALENLIAKEKNGQGSSYLKMKPETLRGLLSM